MDNWTADNIPDQTGRTALITGSNNGIGFEAAKALALKNAHVTLAVRNMEKGEAAKSAILNQSSSAHVEVSYLDLASLESVANFANGFLVDHSTLDLLINNAGIMIPPYSKTKDGFESQMGTNHLGHFALTAKLYDLIDQTTDSRIVNISSGAHKAGNLNFDDLHWENRRYTAWRAYGDSKIANLYFTFELKRRIEKSGSSIKVAAAHPGYAATGLQKSAFLKFMNILVAQSAQMGALPTLMAATDPNIKSGDYVGASRFMEMRGYPKKVYASKLAHDEKTALQLWEVSEALTGTTLSI